MADRGLPTRSQCTVGIKARSGWWLLGWAALIGITLLVNRWHWGPRAARPAIDSWVIKVTGNAFDLLCLPGWAIARAPLGKLGLENRLIAFVAVGLSWMLWLGLVWMLVRIRARIVSGGKADAPNPARVRPASALAVSAFPPLMARRQFLANVAVGVPASAGAIAAGGSVVWTPWNLQVARYEVAIEGLPESLHGLRLVQLSDTHLGPFVPSSHIRNAVRLALELKPDLVLLTGDYIYQGRAWIQRSAELFAPLTRGPEAVATVGTLGNHDWWGDGFAMARALETVGVRMIDNDRLFISARTRGLQGGCPSEGGLCIAGLGDLIEDHIDPEAALAEVPQDMPRIVLAHNPDSAEDEAIDAPDGPRIDLMISGHTHGGQVRFPIVGSLMVPSRYGQKYVGGLIEGPRCRVLVSRGVGMSVLPIRFGVPPEVVQITLMRA